MRYGYFDNEHREYVIDRPDVPVSWTNYLGIKDLCTVISHNAGGYSFYQNAEHKRMMEQMPDMRHNDANARTLEAGASTTLAWRFSHKGEFEFACLLPGHYEAGMHGVVVVK